MWEPTNLFIFERFEASRVFRKGKFRSKKCRNLGGKCGSASFQAAKNQRWALESGFNIPWWYASATRSIYSW